VGTLYTVRFGEVSGLSRFKNFYNRAAGCGEIAYCLLGYFILSHPVYDSPRSSVKVDASVARHKLTQIFDHVATLTWSSRCKTFLQMFQTFLYGKWNTKHLQNTSRVLRV